MTWFSFQNLSGFSSCGKQGDSKYSLTIKVMLLEAIIKLEDAVSPIKSLKNVHIFLAGGPRSDS